MKKFFEVFFIVLGVIFLLLIVSGVYFFVADPLEIRPLIKSFTQPAPANETAATATTTQKVIDKNPILSPAQESALEKIGVDPTKLPTQITPAMEKCFYEKLGAERATEIRNGSVVTPIDYFTARACL